MNHNNLVTTGSQQIDIDIGGYTTAGIKEENQDAFAANNPEGITRSMKGITLCIADGLSSASRARDASNTSVTTFMQDYYATPDTWSVRESAARVLTSLNTWLYQQGVQTSNRHSGNMLTTFSGIICKSRSLHILHVGDSRVYRIREGILELLTRDHSHQYGNQAILSRALGMDNRLEVDYSQHDIEAGDIYLLSTDGVHDFVSEPEILELALTFELSWEEKAKKLAERALTHGSHDNLSCLFGFIKALPNADINEAHRQLTSLVIPPPLNTGMKLDHYEIQKVLFNGTRSRLYLVTDGEKQMALKVPSENFSDDPQYLEGFIREQWIGQQIDHPNIMQVYQKPQNSKFMYLLTEYIEGNDLRQWIYDNPNPSLDAVRQIADQLASALRAFQRKSMVHRDLKPENVMLTPDGHIKLIDFGTVIASGLAEISSIVDDSTPVGSVNYIAPEYLMGEAGVHRSDIFSLGVILYEMLCGKLPFKEAKSNNVVQKSYSDWEYIPIRQVRKDIPLWLDVTLEKACSPSPRDRYPALSELQTDLRKPNQSLLNEHQEMPLIKRNPLLFWQSLSALLAICCIVLLLRPLL